MLPVGLVFKAGAGDGFWADIAATPADYNALNISSVIPNSIPGTIGRDIGGGVSIRAVYWFVYLR